MLEDFGVFRRPTEGFHQGFSGALLLSLSGQEYAKGIQIGRMMGLELDCPPEAAKGFVLLRGKLAMQALTGSQIV